MKHGSKTSCLCGRDPYVVLATVHWPML